MSSPAENAATVREALDVLYHYTSDQANPPGNGRSETWTEGLAAVRALLAQATVRVPPEALGVVTVYDDKGEYAGCMGAETWAWLLAHPDLDASALAALLAQAEAGARWLAWSGGDYPDESPGDVIAAEADGTIVLDDSITTWNPKRAAAFFKADRDTAIRERDQTREALRRIAELQRNGGVVSATAVDIARAALTGDKETT
jgi:hypothetical protein